MIEAVAFLGNYGREYEGTRHNVAWLFEKSLPFSQKLYWENKFQGEFCSLEYQTLASYLCDAGLLKRRDDGTLPLAKDAPAKVYFLKPLTYMNLSGESISGMASFYKIAPENILVVHDEIELPLGTVSLKFSGGLGGHNGLRSTKASLGTADFWRLRFGVGKPSNGQVADYVLGHFTEDEKIILSQVFACTLDVFSRVLTLKEPQRLIPEWGKKKVIQ